MKRIGKATAVALTTALASLVIPLATASSANAAVDCPAQQFCLWSDKDFQGEIFIPSRTGDSWRDFASLNFNDIASSGRNNSSKQWCIYQHSDYRGDLLAVFPPNTQISQLRADLNDRASSARVC